MQKTQKCRACGATKGPFRPTLVKGVLVCANGCPTTEQQAKKLLEEALEWLDEIGPDTKKKTITRVLAKVEPKLEELEKLLEEMR